MQQVLFLFLLVGAVGVGVIDPGQAFLSLGTSGVLFVATESFAPNPDRAVHTFCHCLPGTWHQMSVILSAAGALSTWYEREGGLLAIWRRWCHDVKGRPVDGGHFFPEERPKETAEMLAAFLHAPNG